MIHRIEQIVRIFIQEWNILARREALCILSCTQEFRNVAAILITVHHRNLIVYRFKTTISTNLNASNHTTATTCGDLNDTIRTARTIKSYSILDSFNIFNILRIYNIEKIINKTIMKSRTIVLHILHYTINNDKWLRICIQRIQTIHQQESTLCRHSTTVNCANTSIQMILNIILNRSCT